MHPFTRWHLYHNFIPKHCKRKSVKVSIQLCLFLCAKLRDYKMLVYISLYFSLATKSSRVWAVLCTVTMINYPSQLSLANPSWIGAMSTSQGAVMPRGWEYRWGMVHVWVTGKTMWSPRYTEVFWHSGTLQIGLLLLLLLLLLHTCHVWAVPFLSCMTACCMLTVWL